MNQEQTKTIRHIIYGTARYPRPKPTRYLESELTSNLLLQKILYYNTYYSILFFYVAIGINAFRIWVVGGDLQNAIRLIFILVWGLLEIFRIQNGYSGNIKEQFPELFSFVLITIMAFALQLITAFLKNLMPMEIGLVIIMSIFDGTELILAILSMCTQNKSQIALMSLRVPQAETDYLVRKEIEHLKMEQQMGIRNSIEDKYLD